VPDQGAASSPDAPDKVVASSHVAPDEVALPGLDADASYRTVEAPPPLAAPPPGPSPFGDAAYQGVDPALLEAPPPGPPAAPPRPPFDNGTAHQGLDPARLEAPPGPPAAPPPPPFDSDADQRFATGSMPVDSAPAALRLAPAAEPPVTDGAASPAGAGELAPLSAEDDPDEGPQVPRPVETTITARRAPAASGAAAPSTLATQVSALRARINLFGEAVYVRLRWHLRELVDDLRTRDRFFRWKAAIVAGWIALSVVSLGVARSGDAPAPGENRLKAYVVIRPTTMGWGLLVHNQSRKPWRGVEIRLDGYTYRASSVAAGEQLILGPFQFERDGAPLPGEHVPRAVEIAADQGTMLLSLGDEMP